MKAWKMCNTQGDTEKTKRNIRIKTTMLIGLG